VSFLSDLAGSAFLEGIWPSQPISNRERQMVE